MKSQYPVLTANDLAQACNALRDMARLRQEEDVPDFTNLVNKFVSGRSTTRVPTLATDVLPTDVIGDVVYAPDGSYVYVLIEKTGTPTWARIALNTTW